MLFGGNGNLIKKTATKNGVYKPSEEIDPETEEPYDPPADGYSLFTVDLPLDDKSVSITTSQITGSQTAVFEYDPHDENPELEGYNLFTIDLSGVKDDVEAMLQCKAAVVSAIQQYVPDYVLPASGCPDDGIDDVYDAGYIAGEESVNLGSKFITENGTYLPASDNLDGYNQVVVDVQTWESCIQRIAQKLGLSEPYDCNDIVEKLDDEIGVYVFPEDTPYEKVEEITGMDTVEVVGNDYYWTVRIIGRYGSYQALPRIDFEENAFYVATPPANYNYGGAGWQIKVYEKATGDLVWTTWLGNLQSQGFDAGEYCKLISLSINYTSKTMTGVYEETNTQTPVQHTLVTDMSRYITVQSPNPRYKVKNS